MRNSSNRPGCTRRSSIAFPVSIELKIHDPLTQIFCVVSLKYNSKEHLKLFEQNKWKEKAQANKDPNHPRPVSRLLCETFKIKTLMECYNKFKFIHLQKKKKKKKFKFITFHQLLRSQVAPQNSSWLVSSINVDIVTSQSHCTKSYPHFYLTSSNQFHSINSYADRCSPKSAVIHV
jgi:hypothetical protein